MLEVTNKNHRDILHPSSTQSNSGIYYITVKGIKILKICLLKGTHNNKTIHSQVPWKMNYSPHASFIQGHLTQYTTIEAKVLFSSLQYLGLDSRQHRSPLAHR